MMCPKCKAKSDFNYDSDTNKLVCEKCGCEFLLVFTGEVIKEGT